jgi:hypothetical protein
MLAVLDQAPTNGSAEIGPEENSSHPLTSMLTQPKSGPKNIKIPHMPKKVEEKAVEETPIADTILEIENLKKEEAIECVSSLLEEKKNVDFKLGGVLAAILRNKWFAPHDTFSEFVETKFGLSYRWAKDRIDIFDAVTKSKMDDENFIGLSCCKLREIARVITPENVNEWIAISHQHTVVELKEMVKAYKAKGNPKAITQQSAKPTRKKTFKFHDGQMASVDAAIAKAKEVAGAQDDEAALEYICRDFADDISAARMEERIKKLGAEASLKLFEKCFPDVDLNAVLPADTTA